ncbi:MAG: hypothetical protein EXQ53_06865 [Acidobacteria bacterium]|nr:hypothetical protein [Acidobacteriota bacterium]
MERDLERVLGGTQPILVGPWLSEVGYEVLYWIPFLRWVMAAYRIPEHRLIAMSRGGTESWYRGIASRYVEILDYATPAELSARVAAGALKQREVSDFDRRLVDQASHALGLGQPVSVLHPSLMFRWFAPFWSGHETLGFVERHTRHARIEPPDVAVPLRLPAGYVAVKLYGARALPDEPAVRGQLAAIVDGLSERFPIVSLDTGLGLDDHADYDLGINARVVSVSGHLDARTNLAVQTRIIAGARMFFGTCGSLAWLAPLLGVPTVSLFTDASFLHAHLHVARRVYGRVDGGRFSPVDLSGLADAGLIIGRGDRSVAGTQVS